MVTNYINKDEFQKKIRTMRVKLHMENNKTLTYYFQTSSKYG